MFNVLVGGSSNSSDKLSFYSSSFAVKCLKHCFLLQGECDEALNYAALSFTNKPPSSRGTRRQQKLKDTEVYSQIKYPQ